MGNHSLRGSPLDSDLSAALLEARQGEQESGLSTAGRSDDGKDLTGCEAEGDIVKESGFALECEATHVQ